MASVVLNTGSAMPLIGYGTYKLRGYDLVYRCLQAAIESGCRLIDTAGGYGNEEDIGKALKVLLPPNGLNRKDIFITSKLAPVDQGSERCRAACLKSIEKLDVGYLDLFLIHWPGTQGLKKKIQPSDPCHPEKRRESWQELEQLCKEGKLKAIGVSNYTVSHMRELLSYCEIKPAVLQCEYHPYLVQKDLVRVCQEHNIHFQAYSSLGSMGHCHTLLSDPVIVEMAAKYERSAAQILLRWATQQDIGVIPKSTREDRIQKNMALFDFVIGEEDMLRISSLDRQEHFCWNPEHIT